MFVWYPEPANRLFSIDQWFCKLLQQEENLNGLVCDSHGASFDRNFFLYKASCWIGSGFWLIGNQRIALGLVRGKYPFSFQWRNEWMTVTIPASKRFTQVPRWVSRIQPLASCIQPIVQCFNWCHLDFQLLSSQWFNVSPRKTFQWQLSAQAFNLQVTLGEAMMTPPARHERGATSSSARGAHELPRSLASSSRFLAGQG